MSTITLGRVKFVHRGDYSSSFIYNKDDVVTFNGTQFIYINNTSTSGQDPFIVDDDWEYSAISSTRNNEENVFKLNHEYWAFFSGDSSLNEYKGDWSSTELYQVGDMVTGRSGGCYYAIRPNYDDDPVFNHYGGWEVLIEGGSLDHTRKISLLGCENPIGWRGHPKYTASWGGNTWQGNIPWNIPESHQYDQWNPSSECMVTEVYGFNAISWYGMPVIQGGRRQGSSAYFRNGTDGGDAIAPHDRAVHFKQYYDNALRSSPLYVGNDKVPNELLNQSLAAPASQIQEGHFGALTPRAISKVPNADAPMYLFSDGTIQIYGTNDRNQFGVNESDEWGSGVTMTSADFGGRRIVKIVTAHTGMTRDRGSHIIALDEEGEVWTWGENAYGQCGYGPEEGKPEVGGINYDDNTDSRQPFKLPSETHFDGHRVVDIFAGGETDGFSIFLLDNGDLYACGYNNDGNLGYDTTNGFTSSDRSYVPIRIPVDWSTYGGIQKIAMGGYEDSVAIYILDGEGHIWSYGYNSSGTHGASDGNTSTSNQDETLSASNNRRTHWSIGGSIVNMWLTGAGGVQNGWFLTSNGDLYGIGDNGYYQLDTGNNSDQRTEPVLQNNIKNVVKIVGVAEDTDGSVFALTDDGRVYSKPLSNDYFEAGYGENGDNDNNRCLTQRLNTSQYGWREIHVSNTFYGRVIDIESNHGEAGEAGQSRKNRMGIFLQDEGRLGFTGSVGGGRYSTLGAGTGNHYAGGIGTLVYWGS